MVLCRLTDQVRCHGGGVASVCEQYLGIADGKALATRCGPCSRTQRAGTSPRRMVGCSDGIFIKRTLIGKVVSVGEVCSLTRHLNGLVCPDQIGVMTIFVLTVTINVSPVNASTINIVNVQSVSVNSACLFTAQLLCYLVCRYLNGNPCCKFEGYRGYTVATLPQLKALDGQEISRSERIIATQSLRQSHSEILRQESRHQDLRRKEKQEEDARDLALSIQKNEQQTEEDENQFWNETEAFTPESRVRIHHHLVEKKQREGNNASVEVKKKRMQAADGRMLNVNEAGVEFRLTDSDDESALLLDVAVFRFLDSSLVDVDVQPTFVKILIKEKVLQLVLPEEVKCAESIAERSQCTGHLLITMPKAKGEVKQNRKEKCGAAKKSPSNVKPEKERNFLEVSPPSLLSDLHNIVPKVATPPNHPLNSTIAVPLRPNSPDYVDDPSVPPLL